MADYESHEELEDYLNEIKKHLDIDYTFIKSNCREMYNEKVISRLTALKLRPRDNHGWWASIAHILSMTSLLAPYAYAKKIGVNMLGSSYTRNSEVFDANNEELLKAIKFGSCEMWSIDGALDRTDKAENIINFSSKVCMPIRLKVCWFRHAGENCSSCEKCYRTILDILVNGGDPNMYGFSVNEETYGKMKEYLKKTYVNKGYWGEIQSKFWENRKIWECDERINWILDFKFNRPIAVYNKAIAVVQKFIPIK